MGNPSLDSNTERPPRDHRLFHYTSCLAHLQDMLRHGFWPRYCVEDFSWLVDHEAYMAFPVVCFCDIPTPAASDHRARYGRYALAMSKMWSIGREINPVWYIQAGSSVYFHFQQVVRHPVRVTLETMPDLIKPLLPFLKLTVGAQPDRGALHAGQLEVLPFEDELEWRHTPRCLMDSWKFGYDRNIVAAADHDLSASHRLLLDQDDVDSAYVCAEAEREALTGEFPALVGKVEVLPIPS